MERGTPALQSGSLGFLPESFQVINCYVIELLLLLAKLSFNKAEPLAKLTIT